MKNKRAKFVSILTAAMIIVQTLGSTSIYADNSKNSEDEINIIQSESEKKLSQDIQKQLAQEVDKDVRVIVELQGEPVIQQAINQGIPYSELTKDEIEKSEKKIDLEQKEALEDLKKTLPDIKAEKEKKENEIIHYNTSFNGLAVTVKPEDIQTIKNKSYVKNIYIAEEYERPQMKNSNKTIGSNYAWDSLNYKGDGIVVAVIDSGIDYRHKAMTMDNPQNAKHDENSINKIIRENSLKGKYFTPKVPYGYNYYDHNHNTLDSYGYMHGMHVAGTIGANSSKGAEIDGVAPNVQLLALKVFSDDLQYPTTFTDVWLKAIDDAIVLKADVINMSLGSAAGLASSGERPEDIALKRAKDAGIVVAIAGGNDGNIMTGYHHKDKSRVENPDTSLIASPSLLHDSISVASIENAVKYVNKLYWQDDSANINLSMGLIDSLTAKGIDLGSGEEKDYIGKNVRGKIVLIEKPKPKAKSEEVNITSQTILTVKDSITTSNILNIKEKDQLDEEKPQELSLGEKILLAQNKGAVGIIIYNDPDSGENLGRNISYSSPIKDFPISLIGFRKGQKLIANIKENPDLEINMSNKLEEEPNLYQGEVSFFSSWGPTPDLRIKPEVSAPGGYIYSTAEEDKYQNMSGTSMASPQRTGKNYNRGLNQHRYKQDV